MYVYDIYVWVSYIEEQKYVEISQDKICNKNTSEEQNETEETLRKIPVKERNEQKWKSPKCNAKYHDKQWRNLSSIIRTLLKKIHFFKLRFAMKIRFQVKSLFDWTYPSLLTVKSIQAIHFQCILEHFTKDVSVNLSPQKRKAKLCRYQVKATWSIWWKLVSKGFSVLVQQVNREVDA